MSDDTGVRLHSTLTKRREPLAPGPDGTVGIYVCGPTVYGRIHVGNARPYVMFALFKRFLEHEGYDVTLVENITDIHDKIYAAAGEQGVSSEALAREMTALYRADTDRLGLGRPGSATSATISPTTIRAGRTPTASSCWGSSPAC